MNMLSKNINCKKNFEIAFSNRYTWPSNFFGYKGNCLFIRNKETFESRFNVDKNFKVSVSNVDNEEIKKIIASQLFEVTIHRVKIDFQKVHSKNDFQLIKESDLGMEIIVTGKNAGDKYRIKDKRINMVYRKIHGLIVQIFVEEFIDTGVGFLSKKYTSQQLDINTLNAISPIYSFTDEFINLNNNLWVLKTRSVSYLNSKNETQKENFSFSKLILND